MTRMKLLFLGPIGGDLLYRETRKRVWGVKTRGPLLLSSHVVVWDRGHSKALIDTGPLGFCDVRCAC